MKLFYDETPDFMQERWVSTGKNGNFEVIYVPSNIWIAGAEVHATRFTNTNRSFKILGRLRSVKLTKNTTTNLTIR